MEMDASGKLNKRGLLRAGLTIKDSYGRPLILFANEASVGVHIRASLEMNIRFGNHIFGIEI